MNSANDDASRTTSQSLQSWIYAPPHYLIIGNEVAALDVFGNLEASRYVDDAMLDIAPPPEWSIDGARLLPLRMLRGIAILQGPADEPALLMWRHSKIWDLIRDFGRGERQRLRWLILARDLEDLSNTPVGEVRNRAVHFGHLPGYTVLSLDAASDDKRRALQSSEATDLITWDALRRSDKTRNWLIALRDALQNDPTDIAAVAIALEAVSRLVAQFPYEVDRFCRPPCHENGGKWRRWLGEAVRWSVTANVTQIVQSGRALLPLLQF